MWNQTNYDFGVAAPLSKVKFSFEYSGDKEIKTVSASCGCTVPTIDSSKGIINVVYDAPRVPEHLKETGLKISKQVTVTFKDETTQVLGITGLVKKTII